jgi:CheY-like chemotaxis protein
LTHKSKKNHFIVVDDNPFDLSLIQKTLSNEFGILTLHGFKSGFELLQHFEGYTYEKDIRVVLVVDVNMPIKSGIDTIIELNSRLDLQSKNRLSIFFLTSTFNQRDYDRIKGISTKYQYMLKPFDTHNIKRLLS